MKINHMVFDLEKEIKPSNPQYDYATHSYTFAVTMDSELAKAILDLMRQWEKESNELVQNVFSKLPTTLILKAILREFKL